MKLLIVVNSMEGGGAEKTIQTLVNYWSERAVFENITIACTDRAVTEYPLHPGVRLISLGWGRLNRGVGKALALPLLAWNLARFARRERFDLCLSFLVRANLVNVVSRLFGNPAPPVICEQTSSFDFYRDLNSRLRQRVTWGIRLLYPWAHRIIAASTGVANRLNHGGIPKEKLSIIHNPIPLERFVELRNRAAKDSNVTEIITVGRLSPEKDQATLIRAFARLKPQFPQARLTIVGKGPEEESLKALIEELGVSDVVLYGWHHAPEELLVKSDVFVLTSTSEGFGVVLIEAMACGLPVVSTRCPGGPAEILQDGYSGILTPVGDDQALAESLTGLLRAPERIREFEARSCRRAEDFSDSAIAEQYCQALGVNSPPGGPCRRV